jgi:ribonuclease HI
LSNHSLQGSVPGQWTVYVDGAARSNPGPAAAGICLFDAESRIVRLIGRTLGTLPNNQAEYRALLLALDAALPFAPPALQVRMDSQLVVRQMTGQYRVKDPILQGLHTQVRERLRRFGPVTFEHVPRVQNAEADRLANLALDGEPVDLTPQRERTLS